MRDFLRREASRKNEDLSEASVEMLRSRDRIHVQTIGENDEKIRKSFREGKKQER